MLGTEAKTWARTWAIGAALALALGVSTAFADDPLDILIIANKQVQVEAIALSDAKELFLHKRVNVQGSEVVPIAASKGSRLREEFCRLVLGMTAAEEETYWQERRIRIGDAAPPEFTSPLRAVFRLKSGVGYVRRGEYKEGVAKILLVVPYTPEVRK